MYRRILIMNNVVFYPNTYIINKRINKKNGEIQELKEEIKLKIKDEIKKIEINILNKN